MAHPAETRNAAKIAYIRDRQPLAQIANQTGISLAVLRRWKKAAHTAGDDWDAQRAAVVLAGGDVTNMAQQVVTEMMIQFNSVLAMLNKDDKMDALKRAQALASVSNSIMQSMAFMSRAMPAESRLATGMLVIQKLAEHIRTQRPELLPAFAAILDQFGPTLPAILKDAK